MTMLGSRSIVQDGMNGERATVLIKAQLTQILIYALRHFFYYLEIELILSFV